MRLAGHPVPGRPTQSLRSFAPGRPRAAAHDRGDHPPAAGRRPAGRPRRRGPRVRAAGHRGPRRGAAGCPGRRRRAVLRGRAGRAARRARTAVLVLSPLGVVPEHQGRGIGGRLVEHAVAEAARAGAPLLFLEGSPRYYGRFGFAPGGRLGFTAPSVRIPEAAFQVLTLPGYEPWMTGALVYAEQFWVFDCVGLREPPP